MANHFPRWSNTLPLQIVAALGFLAVGVATAVTYYFTPKYTRVGYQPDQPIPYDHQLHVNQLGMDCRYCHSFVEDTGHANVPTSQTCWNCHQNVKTDSPLLEPLRQSIDPNYENYTGEPIRWVKIHATPDYAYFNHSAHVNRGVSCVSCHGKINEMEVVWHHEPQSMQWCLDCHQNPEEHLRPLDHVTNLDWEASDENRIDFHQYIASKTDEEKAEELVPVEGDAATKELTQEEIGQALKVAWHIMPPSSMNCAGCHR
ncbi:MAG: cytochrome c3 family protein [Verrucomicrobiota bacterium]